MPDRPLEGQIALVTGATAGIDAVTARGRTQAGARAVVVGRDPARCEATVALIRGESGPESAEPLAADLRMRETSAAWRANSAPATTACTSSSTTPARCSWITGPPPRALDAPSR